MMSARRKTLDPINEVNLLYLRLAQRLLREDRASAMSRLGIAEQAASVLDSLSPAQTTRLAASTQVLCRFRFDDHAILSSLGSHDKANVRAQSPAAIPVEAQAIGLPD